ncbi:MAG TPA: ABC transporter permease [Bryobacteraceae bacterium]|nr:ABC transporter permease [Bryobacteraceae bacterium]
MIQRACAASPAANVRSIQMASNASFVDAVRGAAASLRSSKLRSFLTLLGIILATTTLIAVMSVINGMNRYIAENVSNMGADGFRVRRMVMIGAFDPKKYLEMQRRNPELSREEFEFLKSHATLLSDIGMETQRSAVVHFATEQVDSVSVQGVSANMAALTNTQIALGRFLSENDDQRRQEVAFVGNDIRQRFFASTDPIGKILSIEGRPFRVVGVAKSQGSVFGNSLDNFVMIPVETYFKIYGPRTGIGYRARALDHEYLFRAQDEIRMLLRSFRHLTPNQEDTFAIVSSDSLVSAWDNITGSIAATAVAVVSVFMVVGGVVVMNIMLAVVTERTHEIGIRKSVGARRVDILRQFLVESSMLAASGGVIGVCLAWILAVLVRNATPVPMAVPFSAVAISVALSASVGLFFGIYPATRASRLDPIEALRVEQ